MKQFINFNIFLVFLFFTLNNTQAQFYESGQDPASLRWYQIRTPNFQILFPSGYDKEANRLANTMEYLYNHVSKTLNHKPERITVVLHSISSFSNGFVAWAPKRMELFTTPPQDLFGQDWLDQLAVHELRHVVQVDKLNQGITAIAKIILGEQVVGAVTGLIPKWFLEGDAVNTETALSNAGRGRSAEFLMETKALITKNDTLFSYEKIVMGSYKDYIPDHYHTGYPLVAYTRMKYGSDIFNKDLNFVSQNPYLLYPFSHSIKKQTGLSDKKLYAQAYSYLKTRWNSEIKESAAETYQEWPIPEKKCYTNYRFPQVINGSALITVKSGMDMLREFTILYKNGKQEKIYTPGLYKNDRISYCAGKLAWAEEIPDVRWSNRSFYCIRTMDIAKKKVKTITHKTRFFGPAISPDGKKIAAVHISLNTQISLVILDAVSGKTQDEIQSPNNFLIKDIIWSPNGTSLLALLAGNKGQTLYRFLLPEMQWVEILPWTYQNLSWPNESENYIFYSTDKTGTNNIFAYNKAQKKEYQVTNSKYGCFDPNFSKNDSVLYFSSYSSDGYAIQYLKLSEKYMKETPSVAYTDTLVTVSKLQENFNLQDSIVPAKNYDVKRYSKIANIFNIHSWSPFYYDYNNLTADYRAIQPGISLLSQDKLGNCISSLSGLYNNGNPMLKTNILFKGLFPAISFTMDYGEKVTTNDKNVSRASLIASTLLYLPLNFSRGKYLSGFYPQVEWKFNNGYYDPNTKIFENGYHILGSGMSFYWYTKLTLRDIAPRFGFSSAGWYNFKPLNGNLMGSMYYGKLRLYLPGLFKHHSFQIGGGHFEQTLIRYYYSSQIYYARGYYIDDQKYTPISVNALTFDYSYPIWYPDFHISRFFYLKRIRGNFFYDISQSLLRSVSEDGRSYIYSHETLQSYGMEITSDYHLFRIPFVLNSGARITFLPFEKQYLLNFIHRINISY